MADSAPVEGAEEGAEPEIPPVEAGIRERVPMEYRAQVAGRCQRQFIQKGSSGDGNFRLDSQKWVEEWLKGTSEEPAFHQNGLRLIDVRIDWRVMSNSGVDEGFIRPVIAAGGWPLIPGSGIKGLFRRACSAEQQESWCGNRWGAEPQKPGLLRFHGAWPSDQSWRSGLLDVVHPQQEWQVGMNANHGDDRHPAYALVSLRKPHLVVALSSSDPDLPEAEWEAIETTLRRALEAGIGGRTSAGYGRSGPLPGPVLFACALGGQGCAPKLLDGTAEFRPLMFRAAIRGMALRLFGGITTEAQALKAVDQLFGGLGQGEAAQLGLLAMVYSQNSLELDQFGTGGQRQPVFRTSGLLQWRLQKTIPLEKAEQLKELIAVLCGLTMALAGFGRTWRRPDHRLFKSKYKTTPIGCHWQWLNPSQLPEGIHVQSGKDLEALLQRSRRVAQRWLGSEGGNLPTWREVMAPERMKVWVKVAESSADATVIHWFHEDSLKRSDLTGRVRDVRIDQLPTRVGSIWNRLLPIVGSQAALRGSTASATARPARRPTPGQQGPQAEHQAVYTPHGGPFLESVVVFPLRRPNGELTPESKAFLARLEKEGFTELDWSEAAH